MKTVKTTTVRTNKELKNFVLINRNNIASINGVKFNGMYPMLDITNNYVTYYDVESQCNKSLRAPFTIELNS